MLQFYKVFLFINYGLLISILFFIIWKYRLLCKRERQYVYYIVFLFLIELINLFFAYVMDLDNTSFLYPYYIFGEFLLLTSLFLRKLNLPKYLLIVNSLIGILFLLASNFLSIEINYDLAKVISNIIIICLAGFTLLQQMKSSNSKDQFYLVDASIFFYYSVSVFIFVVQSQIVNLSTESVYLLMGTNNVLSTLLYCSIVYTLLKLKK